MKSTFRVIGSLLLVLIGILVIFWGVGQFKVDSSDWTFVEATVLSNDFERMNESTEYFKIVYEYTVEGESYSGLYISIIQEPVGKHTWVVYDPNDPASSVETPGKQRKTSFWLAMFGAGLLGWGVGRELNARKRKPAQASSESVST